MIVLHSLILVIALLLTPLLFSLSLRRQQTLTYTASVTGIMSVALSCLIALTLHTTHTPINRLTLTAAHLILFCLAAAVALIRRPEFKFSLSMDEKRVLIPGVIVLLLIIFPFTNFTGIDTYKWQDLASSVRVDSSLPWIVHPLSLFGFTPRSYPSAYPILLATIQIIGGLGIDGGFFVASILNALIGISTSYALGKLVFAPRSAIIFSLLYAYAPVFVRYTHWATGRGLFLAIFPAFIALLLSRPRHKAWPIAILVGILLLLSHKVALVAIPLLILAMSLSLILPRKSSRVSIGILTVPALLAAAAIVTPQGLPFPLGQLSGLAYTGITRFAWMIPAALIGLLLPRNLLQQRVLHSLFPATLLAIPLAYERHMYGALIALPFVTMMAVTGMETLLSLKPGWRTVVTRILLVLTLIGAVGIVANRSRIATPQDIKDAALFLEHHDPSGPFRIEAPGRVRTQVQAYASGCPRICVSAGTDFAVSLPSPPPFRNTPPRALLSQWASYCRSLLSVSEIKTSWYGDGSRTYYFVVDRKGTVPQEGKLIYDKDSIQIFETGER